MKAYIKNLRKGERERIMFCPYCGNENSADKNDYWQLPEDYEFKCRCGLVMDIVVKKTVYEEVK